MRKFATFAVPMALLAAVIGFALVALGGESAEAEGGSSNLVVVLKGTATGYPGTGALESLTCFDVDLVDPRTDHVIGTATDCLGVDSIVPIGDDGGFGINNTTIFNFPGGTVASLSRTTIQPTEDDPNVFITGEESGDILPDMGTGRFRGATGTTRLSGIVDMTDFGIGIITFDCIFVIDLD